MPQVTVYIREEDLSKWKALEKKSEFMHNALLAIDVISSPGKSRLYAEIITRKEREIVDRMKTPMGARTPTGTRYETSIKPVKNVELCEHGSFKEEIWHK